MKITPALAEGALQAYKTLLDGFGYVFNGPVPENASDALDMDDDHTLLGIISVDGDGTTEPVLDDADGNVIVKPAGDDWIFPLLFVGANDTEDELAPTFVRFCGDGDNGQGSGTGLPRLQMTASGPTGSGEAIIADLLDSGPNDGSVTRKIDFFRITKSLNTL